MAAVLPFQRRAERLGALLDGSDGRRHAGEPADEPLLALAAALRTVPPPPGPDYRDALRTRLLATAAAGQLGVDGDAPLPVLDGAAATNPMLPVAAAVPSPVAIPVPFRNGPGRHAPARPNPLTRLGHQLWRPVTIGALAAVTAVVGVGIGASGALPGDTLYGVKRGYEQLRVDLTTGRVAKARVHLDLARTRLAELHDVVRRDHISASRPPTAGETATINGLLRDWSAQATAGGGALLTEAGRGHTDAASALLSFTTTQTRSIRTLLPTLPDGRPRTLASSAIVYMTAVDHSLTGGRATVPAPRPSPTAATTAAPADPTTRPSPTPATTPAPATGTPDGAATPTATPGDGSAPGSASGAASADPTGGTPATITDPARGRVPGDDVLAPDTGTG